MWKVVLMICALGNPCVIFEEDPIPKENRDVPEPLSLGHTDTSSQPNVDALPVEPILSGQGTAE